MRMAEQARTGQAHGEQAPNGQVHNEQARSERVHTLPIDRSRRRGRGATGNARGRFESVARDVFDDGWGSIDDLPAFKTHVTPEKARRVVTRNDSPDLPFDRSVNPYRGCEHGCVYCYARPTHSFVGLSAGLDFETRLFAKPGAARLLEKELAQPGYECRSMALGTNTDPYQPIERQWRVTREILEVLERTSHPVGIVTKSHLVTRDIDILSRMAKRGLARVAVSVTTLDGELARRMEPRCPTPAKRLDAIRQLSEAGIPTSVVVAPLIPALNDHEMERILEAGRAAGAMDATFTVLRLPHEVRGLWKDWMLEHYPDRYGHVMQVLRSMRGGRDNDATFGLRMRGSGPYAWQLERRFEMACRRLKLDPIRAPLRTDLFEPPVPEGAQMSLFDAPAAGAGARA